MSPFLCIKQHLQDVNQQKTDGLELSGGSVDRMIDSGEVEGVSLEQSGCYLLRMWVGYSGKRERQGSFVFTP